MEIPTVFVALIAGLLSFLTPCILPLVPAYIAVLTGGAESGERLTTFWRALIFVLGFSMVFILMGLSASAIGQYLRSYRYLIEKIGGVLVILLGLHQLGVYKLTPLYRQRKFRAPQVKSSWTALLVGVAFAFGWTPCVGPILAGILTLAGSGGNMAQGVILLTAYSLGLGLPFLITALGYAALKNKFNKISRWARYFELGGGVLLIILGILLVMGRLEIIGTMFRN